MYRPEGKGSNKAATRRMNSSMQQFKQPGSYNMGTLDDDILCGSCNKMLNRARFSNTALTKYRSALFAAKSRRTGANEVRQPNCRDCTGGDRQEMFCQGCQKSYGLDKFSKNQRRKPDNAHCWDCVQAAEDRVGDVTEAIEEQKILERLENPSATSTAAFNTGSLQGALSSINKHYGVNSAHSYAGRSEISGDSDGVWIQPDTSTPGRDGLREPDLDSESGVGAPSSMNTPSLLGHRSNGGGWDDSTPIEQVFRRHKSSTTSYATGGSNSGFVKQGAYRPDIAQRAIDQHRRDQVRQLQAAHEEEEEDDDDLESASDSDDPY